MTWRAITRTPTQYVDTNGDPYSGAVLKFYASGTTTNIPLATDSGGGTQVDDAALNASGFPEVSGNIIIPHIDQSFKLALYPTQAAADADSGAIWTIDGIPIDLPSSEWTDSGVTPVYSIATAFTVAGDQTAEFHVGRRLKLIDSGGTDYATITESTYSDPDTTVTASVDLSGALDSGLSSVQLSIFDAENISIPFTGAHPDGGLAIAGNLSITEDCDFDGDCDATPNQFSGAAPAFSAQNGVLCPHKNLVVANNSSNPTYQVDVSADQLVVYDTNGIPKVLSSVDLTIDLTASGELGLDTGSEETSIWYHIWVLAKADGTVTGVLSKSASSPASQSGYTYEGYVSAAFNDGTGNLVAIKQKNHRVNEDDRADLSGGSAATPTAVTLTIPPTARKWIGTVTVSRSGAGTVSTLITPTTTVGLGVKEVLGTDATGIKHNIELILEEDQTLYYDLVNGDDADITTTGWEF